MARLVVALALCATSIESLVNRRFAQPSSHRAVAARCTMEYEMPKFRRVVVTGMGIVSCLGNTLDDVADSLHETPATFL